MDGCMAGQSVEASARGAGIGSLRCTWTRGWTACSTREPVREPVTPYPPAPREDPPNDEPPRKDPDDEDKPIKVEVPL